MHIYSSFSIIFKIELPLVRSPRCSCLQSRHLFGKEDRIFQFHMDDNHNDHNNNNQIKNITIQTESCGHKIKIMQRIKWWMIRRMHLGVVTQSTRSRYSSRFWWSSLAPSTPLLSSEKTISFSHFNKIAVKYENHLFFSFQQNCYQAICFS